MILVKNCKFSFCLFWDKMDLEVVLDDYVVTKLCKTKLCTHDFGQKLQIFLLFVLGQNGP